MPWKLFRSRKATSPPATTDADIGTLRALAPGSHSTGASAAKSTHRTPPLVIEHMQSPGKRPARPRFPLTHLDDELGAGAIQAPSAPDSRGFGKQPEHQDNRRSASAHSLRSSGRSMRSVRSVRSVRSTRSTASQRQRQVKAKAAKRAALAKNSPHQHSGNSRDCFVCGKPFVGVRCDTCDTTYTTSDPVPAPEGTPLDLNLVCDLAEANEYAVLEAVVLECFSEVANVTASFFRPHLLDSGEFVDMDAVLTLYQVLDSVSSTCPMRAVLQGAQTALQLRSYGEVSIPELAYLLVVMACPVFSECSMFIKITGPLQKLARYASLRSRARVVLEVCCGLLANVPPGIHELMVSHYGHQDNDAFRGVLELCNAYIGHRLNFHLSHKGPTGPSTPARHQSTILHEWYAEDWRIASVAKVLGVYFQAGAIENSIMPLSAFYNTMLDHIDIRADFDSWQMSRTYRRGRFTFCQYPFLLSMGAKIRVYEHAVRREVNGAIQRELLARLARNPYAPVPTNHHNIRLLHIRVRRSNLLQDSLAELGQWPRSQRRALRVEFINEPGIDAGGPKKEWFLLFFRTLLDPALGVFDQDDESNYCWFTDGIEHESKVMAAGIALGLALFNSVSIDLNLPPILFKMLLDAPYSLEDVGKLWPSLAQGLSSVLEYEGDDFEEALGLTFTAPDGTPLLQNAPPVTQATKGEYVKRLVTHELEKPGFAAFKRGFLQVSSGNAMALFQPEEVESLIRGDREPLDVATLRTVTKYVHFGARYDQANQEPIVEWFWDYFGSLDPIRQAALLTFVTATDRVPATGIVNMRFRIQCLGPDSERLPVAHTCFNQLGLYRYATREKLERKLNQAVTEAQGFGIK